ncbi:MAG TPA: hypothetical protein VGO93_25165, partial [Candidatus Xenobia bacterium]
MPEEIVRQIRAFFGVVEVITESHDIPRGVPPKYYITLEGEGKVHESHFNQPPRNYFFVSPGEYTCNATFLGVIAEPQTFLLQAGDTVRLKFHFHGHWSQELGPKPAPVQPRAKRPQAVPPPAQQPAYQPPAYQPPAYQPPGQAQPAAAAYAPPAAQPNAPPAAFAPTPPPPAAPVTPARPTVPAAPSTMPAFAGTGASATIAPPPMPVASHAVPPPPPPPRR